MGRVRNSNQIPHRPGPLVQANKKHKAGKHRTKGAIDNATRGRISSISSTGKPGKQHVKRSERKKQAAVNRIRKMQEVVDKKRSQGGMRGAPICIALIPLSASCNVNLIREHIVEQSKSFSTFLGSTANATHLKLSNGKNLTLLLPPTNEFWAVLDTLKLSDVVLFVMPTLEPISEVGLTLLQCAKEQGCPTKFMGVSLDFTKTEERSFLKSISKIMPLEKIYPMINPGQISNLLRMITVAKINTPKQYSIRSGMLIESCEVLHLDPSSLVDMLPYFRDDPDSVGPTLLKVSGYIRKRNLNPHRPVHIVGHGTYQILRIDITPIQDVKAVVRRDLGDNGPPLPTLDAVPPFRFMFNPKDTLVEELDNTMDDDMSMAATDNLDDISQGSVGSCEEEDTGDDMEIPKEGKRLPKGTSDYQADWLIDSDSEKEKELMSDDEELESLKGSDAESETEGDEDDEDMDWAEDQKQFQLAKAARTEAEFPDWIDTPQDVIAKDRFQRYRGLQSFKTSPWDVNENLPKEYSKICQFQNYRHTYKKAVVKDAEDGPLFVPVGQRVSMILKPFESGSRAGPVIGQCPPITLISLLAHETKMTVLNLHLNLSGTIKNKETLVFQVGFQRFQAKPILSEVSPGNKHKMLRYGQTNESCMVTVYGPIVFPVASVLVFKASGTSLMHVGSGSLFSVDPARIVIKRILLSGYPFRVHGRKSTVRFMFFNRQDIEWFKPVELKTRYGRRGHIREPLGTHGYMKCVFDGALKSQDTILMPLYKRVFPKMNYDSFVPPYVLYDRYDN